MYQNKIVDGKNYPFQNFEINNLFATAPWRLKDTIDRYVVIHIHGYTCTLVN